MYVVQFNMRSLVSITAVIIFLAVLDINHGYSFDTKYISVPLDHFSFARNTTFQLRYLVNDTFHNKNGPIFFYTGNEGDIDMFAQNSGFMFDIAPQFNALIIFCEHRFYGESLPFGNKSYSDIKYLGYLSSTQALADFALLINELQKPALSNTGKRLPVVAFGGSYGGMLAAYLRMKYPYSIIGAIASSAPIWQFPYMTDCGNFALTATNTFEQFGGKKCTNAINSSWAIIRNFTNTTAGRTHLSELWHLCDTLKDNVAVNFLIDWLSGIYYSLAEMNYPYDTNFIEPLPANPVTKFCDHIQEKYEDELLLLEDMGKAMQVYINYTGNTKCINLNQTASDDLGEKGWNFQACTDMVQYLCSTDKDMFETYDFDFDVLSDGCFQDFGVRPRSMDVPYLEYGGKDLTAYSNIVFSNGGLDPWSGLGVLEDINPSVISVFIPNGAHHSDLRAENELDYEEVKEARKIHVKQISKWLVEYYLRETEPTVYT